jgi:hypothetical protein
MKGMGERISQIHFTVNLIMNVISYLTIRSNIFELCHAYYELLTILLRITILLLSVITAVKCTYVRQWGMSKTREM